MSSQPYILGLHLQRSVQPEDLLRHRRTGAYAASAGRHGLLHTATLSAYVGSPCNKSACLLEVSQTPRKGPGLKWSVGTTQMKDFRSVSMFSTWRAKAQLSTGTSAISAG